MIANAQIDTRGNMTRRVQDMRTGAGRFMRYSQPWDITFAGAVATLTDCLYMRGPITREVTVADYTVTGADGYIWLSAKINVETGTAEIIDGASLALATDAVIPADLGFIKVPLYKISKVTVATVVYLSVVADYRNAMNLTLYV